MPTMGDTMRYDFYHFYDGSNKQMFNRYCLPYLFNLQVDVSILDSAKWKRLYDVTNLIQRSKQVFYDRSNEERIYFTEGDYQHVFDFWKEVVAGEPLLTWLAKTAAINEVLLCLEIPQKYGPMVLTKFKQQFNARRRVFNDLRTFRTFETEATEAISSLDQFLKELAQLSENLHPSQSSTHDLHSVLSNAQSTMTNADPPSDPSTITTASLSPKNAERISTELSTEETPTTSATQIPPDQPILQATLDNPFDFDLNDWLKKQESNPPLYSTNSADLDSLFSSSTPYDQSPSSNTVLGASVDDTIDLIRNG
ncbi:Oidioi.mRNA.OKI2018_I69.PAR.g10670.t1.cds [Oikopleura dioica]|uniref:Oidioi.mRNA.OKI2018_I69.PAR.g10670.t1.cds n=1 Tax=Oikopleura dioica TaxID=34765 RepID=A0ABN7RZ78_OIKDI|nr:Oidioi.mRNA.OKI2018_I69.PAR.g10670.t1.cds [Oikopleura dioica]